MTTLATYPGRDLPPIVQRAIARANDPSILTDLTPANRWALSVLLRRASAEDGTDIVWVKRSNFAQLMGVSEATVYRTLATLERLGLIERVGQKRGQDGEFSVGEIRFTEALCRLLGLTRDRDESTVYKRADTDSRLARVKDGVNTNQGIKQFSSKKHSQSDSACKNENGGHSGRSRRLPTELDVLREQGLTLPQIFFLMRLATSTGKRLGDIVAVSTSATRELRGTALFAYLRKLTQAAVDFGFVRRAKEEEQAQAQQRIANQALIADLKRRFTNRWLRSSSGARFFVDSTGFAAVYEHVGVGTTWRRRGVISGTADEAFWLAVNQGQIQPAEALCATEILH